MKYKNDNKKHKGSQVIGRAISSVCALLVFAMLLTSCTTTKNPAMKHENHSKPSTKTTNQPKIHGAQPQTEHQHEHHEHRTDLVREGDVGSNQHFHHWLSKHPKERIVIEKYQDYLNKQLGAKQVPPLSQLLTTARSWQTCGFEPYQVPPESLWSQMLPTIRLYNELKQRQILPTNTQIRSVYRNPELNRCAGGAAASKHMTNGAMDIWVPNYEIGSWQMQNLQDNLCSFWLERGEHHQFGLGLYATGAIHLDTQGYRKWGAQFSRTESPCRITPPKR